MTSPHSAIDSPSKIFNRLWVGGYGSACSKRAMKTHQFSHVVNCSIDLENVFDQDSSRLSTGLEDEENSPRTIVERQQIRQSLRLTYFRVPVNDNPQADIGSYFEPAVEFIRQAIDVENGICYVHCARGVSRSSTIVMAYLMKCMGMSLKEAFECVLRRRPCVLPNIGFMNALIQFESDLSPELSTSTSSTSESSSSSMDLFDYTVYWIHRFFSEISQTDIERLLLGFNCNVSETVGELIARREAMDREDTHAAVSDLEGGEVEGQDNEEVVGDIEFVKATVMIE